MRPKNFQGEISREGFLMKWILIKKWNIFFSRSFDLILSWKYDWKVEREGKLYFFLN